jgi:thiol-disulfide isomerase/thioredoxin
MSQSANGLPTTRHPVLRRLVVVAILLVACLTGTVGVLRFSTARAKEQPSPEPRRIKAPELDGGVGWLNTAGPIHLKDLHGKVVLLDFWCFCCINCMHVLPDLERLEKKYANQLVIIGVHSAKFDSEKETGNIRKAILRYEITHPVVNDANMKIWNAYGVESWPTFVLIDPDGNYRGQISSEGRYDLLDRAIGNLVKTYRAKKALNERPLRFALAHENGENPLFFPGKVLADEASHRLFIADSTHHRIVITDLDGRKIAIAGTGEPGQTDGSFAKAQFNSPQGMALQGDTLYVADCKNHLLRALDLKAKTVRTVAGTGQQGQDRQQGGAGLKTALNSPWDLCLVGHRLFIAMAGHHQIWSYDLTQDYIAPYAGYGAEAIQDGPLAGACFAQPSGLTTDGKFLYVADSEGSAIRRVPLGGFGNVRTIIGNPDVPNSLFLFGDADGIGRKARLQHCLGVAYHAGRIYVADTYNDKIKIVNPLKRSSTSWLGGGDGWLTGPVFSEPGGLSFAGDKLYVADTNAHRIRVIDLKTKRISTLHLQGVTAPNVGKKHGT